MYKRYWTVKFWKNGFEGVMLVYGTEMELWEYLNSELRDGYSYSGATDSEVRAAKVLKIKIYLCPEVSK